MLQKSRIFTPQNLKLLREMAEAGSSAIEIAKTIGSTPASVRVVCSRHKVRLRRRGRPPARKAPLAPLHHTHPLSDHIIVAHMPTALFVEFHRKAEHLQIPISILASNLLAAIATSNIYEAVLDDKEHL
jgi:hypothetical protein